MEKLPFVVNEVNIGVNKSYIVTHHAGFISPYYAVSDATMYKSCMDAYDKIGVEQVLTYEKIKEDFGLEFDGDVPTEYINYLGGCLWEGEDFEYDLEKGTHTGWTVVIDLAIPWAMYMGCNPIYLIGCDCTSTGHAYKEEVHPEENVVRETDRIIESYRAVRKVAEVNGFSIYNATKGGELEVFERVNFNELF
jgi:hypothetical protein